jgi:streptogramin lyase
MKNLFYRMLAAALALTANHAFAAACGPVYGADGIAVDALGKVWISHYEDIRIGKLDPDSGRFEEYLPAARAEPTLLNRDSWSQTEGFDYGRDFGLYGIALDNNRGLTWSIRFNSDKLMRFSHSDNRFSEIGLPGRIGGRFDLPMDKDGNLWLLAGAADGDSRLMRIAADGSQTAYPLPVRQATNLNVAVDRQGHGWLSLTPKGSPKAALYRFDAKGFSPVKLPDAVGLYLTRLHVDKQGELWFATGNDIWHLRGKVSFERHAVPTANAHPAVLASDEAGNLWFTEWYGNKIGRIATDGKLTEYPLPPEEEMPMALAVDGDGKVWFSAGFNYDLFRLDPADGRIEQFPLPVPGNWSKNAAEGMSACVVKPKDAMTKDLAKIVTLQSPATEQMIHPAAVRHPTGFPEDKGAVVFENNCHTACHTWYRMDKAANRRSDWGPTVDRMIEFNKAAIIPADRDAIVDYLNRHYTMKK